MPPPVPTRQLSYDGPTSQPVQTSTPSNVTTILLRRRQNSNESMDSNNYGNSPAQPRVQSVQVTPSSYNGSDDPNDIFRRNEQRASGE